MMLRTAITDLFGSTTLPAIHHVIQEEYAMKPKAIESVFNIQSSDRDIEQTTGVSGFGVMSQVNEGQSLTYDDAYQMYSKTYSHLKYVSGFKVSEEMMDDEKFGLISKMSANLGRAAAETQQIIYANIFNRAFNSSYTGPDGKVLCATDHPTFNSTNTNRPTNFVDLSVSALKSAIIDFRNFVDHRGKKISIRPKFLLVPPNEEANAIEILESSGLANTADNNINPLKKLFSAEGLQVLVCDYLTDTDAWFLVSDPKENELNIFKRQEPQISVAEDFDAGAHKVKLSFRESSGFSDWRGVWGSQGI